MLPEFAPPAQRYHDPCLPPGIHDATWAEVVARFSFSATRRELVAGLRKACLALREAGVAHLYLDGGFVTGSKNPKDWDACFDYASVTDFDKLDKVFLDHSNDRAAQKKKYCGETFPANAIASLGEPYLSFFQKNKRTGGVKGIIKLDLGTVT